jgi:small GTP-binding protein
MAGSSSNEKDLRPQQFEQLRTQVGNLLEDFAVILQRVRELDPAHITLSGLVEKHQETRRKWDDQRFQVAVLALVKSGKSTLINAWLGDEYLPAANTPETTRIVRVRHAIGKGGVLRSADGVLARGATETNDYLRNLNKEGRESGYVPRDDELVLEAPLMALKGSTLGQQRFELLDTPGPNEAGTPMLRSKVEQVLDSADVIVYVLDYTKLKTAEEQLLLETLKDMRPELLRRCSERLFFVVNKIDQENRNGLSPKETASYVAGLIQDLLPDIRLTPERVIPVAAEFALLARIVADREPSEKTLRDFSAKVFGISNEDATLEECRQNAPRLLKKSQVTRLEEEVISFIYRQRGRLMLQSFLDVLHRSLALLGNYLQATQGALKKDHAELVRRKAELEGDLSRIKEGLQRIDETTRQFQAQTEKWVRSQFDRFKKKAQELIGHAFNPSDSRRIPARLMGLVEKVRGLLRMGDNSKEEATQRIRDVNGYLIALLETEFEVFRDNLEADSHERQRALNSQLQALINPLARRIEKEVGKALNTSLKPVPLRIPELSLGDFHNELQVHVDSLIKEAAYRRSHVSQERRLAQRGGLCSSDKYEMVNVTTYSTHTMHVVAGENLQRLWSTLLDDLTQTSVTTARSVVGQMVNRATRQARKELDAYSDSFMQIIERELKESESGTSQREERLQRVGAWLHEVEALAATVDTCLKGLEDPENGNRALEVRDVFICHDSRDRDAVVKIAGELGAHGITTWIDFENLRPGFPWQPALEQQIQTARSVAVFIGKNGLTFWQEIERQAFFREFKKRQCPIIPVILEDCEQEPDLPPFLEGMQKVDFRHRIPDPIEQLIFGIRGHRSPLS